MAFIIKIDGSRLIDLLEEEFRNVYENTKEGDKITKVKLHYGDEIEIVIGEEEIE